MLFRTYPVPEVIETNYTIRLDEQGKQVFHFEPKREPTLIDIDDDLEIEDD